MRQKNDGFTLIEMLIVVGIIGIIAAIAMAHLHHAHMASNEASAIGSLRVINSAETTFASSCAPGSYAASLVDLARGAGGSGPAFISPDLAGGNPVTKSGYRVQVGDGGATASVGVTSCNQTTNLYGGYSAWADPFEEGVSGARHFATNTTGTIWAGSSTLAAIGSAATAVTGGSAVQ